MSAKRPRSNPALLSPVIDQPVAILTRSQVPAHSPVPSLLHAAAAAEALIARAATPFRAAYVAECASAAAVFEALRAQSAVAVAEEAAAAARRAAVAAAEAEAESAAPLEGETLTRTPASAAAVDAASSVLRDYGAHASADVVCAIVLGDGCGVIAGDSDAPVTLPPPCEVDAAYSARPLHGATSAALYLRAEREVGPPPPVRSVWRYPPDTLVACALDPQVVAEAREALKLPAWPDRAFPVQPPLIKAQAAGAAAAPNAAPYLQAVALAAQYDEAAVAQASVAAMELRAYKALSRL